MHACRVASFFEVRAGQLPVMLLTNEGKDMQIHKLKEAISTANIAKLIKEKMSVATKKVTSTCMRVYGATDVVVCSLSCWCSLVCTLAPMRTLLRCWTTASTYSSTLVAICVC